jgi:hypothetical protein
LFVGIDLLVAAKRIAIILGHRLAAATSGAEEDKN